MARARRFPKATARVLGLALLLALASTAFAQTPPPDPRAAAARRLELAEAQSGRDSAEVIPLVIDLAAASVAAGDLDASAGLLERADSLLEKHPEQDRGLTLRVLVLQSQMLASAGRLTASSKVLYAALDLAQKTTSIGVLEQANVLERLAANESRRGRVQRANGFVRDALALRGKHFGVDSPEYAAALLRAADSYRYNSDFRQEVEAEKNALQILERNFGPKDSRLAIPLIRLATTRIAQHAQPDEAADALSRASALDFGPGMDSAFIRAEVLATQGDMQVVFGRPEDGRALYVQAWQALAGHEGLGEAAANNYFRRVRQVYIAPPQFIANEGLIDLGYTVTALGLVDDVRILGNAVPAVDGRSQVIRNEAAAALWSAMRRSRYRPRVVNGVPVATPDLSFSSEFCVDPTQMVPVCSGKADATATR